MRVHVLQSRHVEAGPRGDLGGSLGSNEHPFLLTYWFLLLLPACLTLVSVVFGYCIISVQLRTLISRSVYLVKLVICKIRVELASEELIAACAISLPCVFSY